MLRFAVFSGLLASLLASAVLAQQELWVEPVLGNDGNSGAYDQPLRSLTTAASLAGPNAKIHLLPGTYGALQTGEVFPINLGMTPQANLVVRGIGDVVFDLSGAAATVFRTVNGADGMRITNLTIRNSDQTGWWTRVFSSGSGVNSADAAMNVEIDRCRFENVNRVFVLWTSDVVTGWRVHDNLFVNCSNDAILEYSGTNEFSNNTFYGGLYKAYISDSTTSLAFNNLVVGYNIAFENNTSGAPVSRFQGNWMFNCATVAQGAGFGGALPPSNVIGVDPLFVNPIAGDFHVQPTSTTIDAGVMPAFVRADNETNSRVVDGDGDGLLEIDIGCYERTPLHLSVNWDVQNRLMWLDGTTSLPGTFAFVLFSFDDGLVQVPGQGPILVDQTSYLQFLLTGPLPQQWVFSLQGYMNPPGQRLVMQILGIGPNHVGGALFGGNQVWVNL
jgi:hypothetical protein